MRVETDIDNLGIPQVEFAGLKIWIHGRKYPEFQDFWDGNWLNTTLLCKDDGAAVWVSGDILHLSEFAEWLFELENLEKRLSSEASLETLERFIKVKMRSETMQRVSIKVDISPNPIFQKHYFEFWLERSCLNGLIASCQKVLTEFPIRGEQS